VTALCGAGVWDEAIRVSLAHGRDDLLDSDVQPSAEDSAQQLAQVNGSRSATNSP
jgi:hypothetical protein